MVGVTAVDDCGGIGGGSGDGRDDDVFCNGWNFVGGEIEEVIDEEMVGFGFFRRELLEIFHNNFVAEMDLDFDFDFEEGNGNGNGNGNVEKGSECKSVRNVERREFICVSRGPLQKWRILTETNFYFYFYYLFIKYINK